MNEYKGVSVEKFLDEYLKQANHYGNELLESLTNTFNRTINLVFNVLGEEAFILPARQRNTTTPAKNIYDSLMLTFTMYLNHEEKLLISAQSIRDNIYKEEEKLKISDDNRNLFDGRYNSRSDIKQRMSFYREFLDQFIN